MCEHLKLSIKLILQKKKKYNCREHGKYKIYHNQSLSFTKINLILVQKCTFHISFQMLSHKNRNRNKR